MNGLFENMTPNVPLDYDRNVESRAESLDEKIARLDAELGEYKYEMGKLREVPRRTL